MAGGAGQQIDRILLSARRDLAVQMLLPDMDNLSACSLQNLTLRMVVANRTAADVDVDDTVTVQVGGADNRSLAFPYRTTIAGNAADTVTVTNALDLSAEGSYSFVGCLATPDDDPANDTARAAITIRQDIALADVSGIDSSTLYEADDRLTVKAVIRNNGTVTVDRVVLRMFANGHALPADTLRTHIKAGDSAVHQMAQPFAVPSATMENPAFSFRMEALLDCDANTNDNSLSLSGKVNVPDTAGNDTTGTDTTGIRIAEKVDWQLGQNIPNPASNITAIPFTLPQDGEVTLSVTAANGQLVLRRSFRAQAGNNTAEIGTGDWADGIYYYSLEYRGQRLTRKMNIAR